MLKQIQSEAAAGGDNSPFLDDMASNIRPLRRRLRLTKGRLVGRMTQERQKLSFFIVIMFLVIFGLIVLAEVGYQVNIRFYLLNLKNSHESGHFLIFLGQKILKNFKNGNNSKNWVFSVFQKLLKNTKYLVQRMSKTNPNFESTNHRFYFFFLFCGSLKRRSK